MQTKIIGFSDKFFNIFTKYGRERNHLFKELNKNGYKYILERELPNNSRVILGYENQASKGARLAFKVNPDLTMEQKRIDKKYVLNGLGDKYLRIEKIWAGSDGKQIAKNARTIKTRNKKIAGKSEFTIDSKNAVVKYEGECVDMLSDLSSKQISKIYKRTKMLTPESYQFRQYTDGTRDYEKFINEIEYKFSTKH